MRIISVRFEPVARVMSVVYAFLGVIGFCQFAFSDAEYLTLPIGVVAPLIYLNFNLKLQRSTNIAYNLFLCLAEIIAYAISGWITGAAAALCFNLVAKRMGGIDAKYVSAIDDEMSSKLEN
ncbi:MAG: hypothetical protein ABR906_01510 [Terracidiphilus sp.]|jgi:hypothetical protein